MKMLSLAAALLLAFSPGPAKPADYAGTWTLDAKQSKNLPPYYSEVRSHRLTVSQDDRQLKVAVDIVAEGRAPLHMNFTYNLDGTESKTETTIRTPGGDTAVPTTLKAIVNDAGRVHITIARDITMQGQSFKGVTEEDWSLSADGKTLTIHRADDTPRGTMESDMVFVKS